MGISGKTHRRWVIAVCSMFFIVLLALSARAEMPSRADPTLGYKDRVEIEDLFYKYSLYLDNRLGEAFASTFTSDGTLEFPGTAVRGHDQLVAFGSRPAEDKIRSHFVGSILLVRVAPGHVRARSMVVLAWRDVHGQQPTQFDGVGVYEDDIVKTASGWRFSARHADASLPVSPEFLPNFGRGRE